MRKREDYRLHEFTRHVRLKVEVIQMGKSFMM